MRTCSVTGTLIRWKYHLGILSVLITRLCLSIQERVNILVHFLGMSHADVNRCEEMAILTFHLYWSKHAVDCSESCCELVASVLLYSLLPVEKHYAETHCRHHSGADMLLSWLGW